MNADILKINVERELRILRYRTSSRDIQSFICTNLTLIVIATQVCKV